MKYRKEKLANLFDDPLLLQFKAKIENRQKQAEKTEKRLTGDDLSLKEFANAHEYFGLHISDNEWVFREWAPNATDMYLVGDFSEWKECEQFRIEKIDPQKGIWETKIPIEKMEHKQLYKLHIYWDGGSGERIPAYARRVVQNDETKIFSAQIWEPDNKYIWSNPDFKPTDEPPIIYESHIGMAQEEEGVGTYEEFRKNVLPRIIDSGYNTVQIMALMEHPYYGSFGYHVSSFFAASSRFGTPEELKALIDEAHENGVNVIMDLIHSHAVKNENEGLARFDGTEYQYFHAGERGIHSAWDSRCFNYGKTEVMHFLLSNCKYWLDEFKIDGFRFDGITSMLYYDHGLGTDFMGYDHYFDESVDEDALTYLTLANKLIHEVKQNAITVAEDVSGMPGLGAPRKDGGIGFDFRLALGVPDFWFELVKNIPDENWFMDHMFYELTNRRQDEKTISYVECHDQAIVGSKTMAFELMDASMYSSMNNESEDIVVDRGIALHKMMRLITISTAGGGYLNFMGNEFGHPEWIDFPREGNNWSYQYARRQWSLRDNGSLRYKGLGDFDRDMVRTIRKYDVIEQKINKLYAHNDNQILVYKRGVLVFVFNFNPKDSFTDYFVTVPQGDYNLILDSDKTEYGGQGRIQQDQFIKSCLEMEKDGIKLYIPSRTAMILRKN
ncbi:MAG: alpha amylase C-terminal domain-containing protein [Victivallales bacterium]|nr:alpha amylase C-terminal domain-containing protein [Victivallales bacterium]MCF7889112.1 alpha amylase C-terminal domain-containing protein [Victivallales bacterium]